MSSASRIAQRPTPESIARGEPQRTPRHLSNAGLLSLEAELRRRSDYELADQITLLVEVLPTMADVTMPRLRIASWLLRERLGGQAA